MKGIEAKYKKYRLIFKRPGGTSRGVLANKDSWFIILSNADHPEKKGIGECSVIRGLSPDDRPGIELAVKACCEAFNKTGVLDEKLLAGYPALRFGIETARRDLKAEKERVLFPSEFTRGGDSIPINGLVWMGDLEFMDRQIRDKLKDGFTCLKLKIGALDFEAELDLLKRIRKEYTPAEIELRVDANGAFHPGEALEKLKKLSEYNIHSIEQPIRQGQLEEMGRLCKLSPLPIALDEELIGIDDPEEKHYLLKAIKPQYIILKPSLVGGIEKAEEWIHLADQHDIGWWVTSALESNIGLNAIAQWTYTLKSSLPQGLGTGQLFTNNFPSPLFIVKGQLHYNPTINWELNQLFKG
jgi:o-succinylbenzoate synthase